MKAIETLMGEHQVILKVLNSLEDCIDDRDTAKLKEHLPDYVTFIQGFADKLHHGKEEVILFKEMGNYGFPADSGPVMVMLQEHDLGRGLVKTIKEMSVKDRWDDDDLRTVKEAGTKYITLLRQHINKEDTILFPMAKASLPEASLTAIDDEFDLYGNDSANSERRRELEALAEVLVNIK